MQITQNDESNNCSHFVLKTKTEEVIIVTSKMLDNEDIDFEDEVVQCNIFELLVKKYTVKSTNFNRELSNSIFKIFSNILNQNPNTIIYISVKSNSPKEGLIKRYLEEDTILNCCYMLFILNGFSFYFIQKLDKLFVNNSIKIIPQYFKENYDIDCQLAF